MHELIVEVFLVLFGADLLQPLNLAGVNERGLDHVGLSAGKLGLRYLLLILLGLSNEEVEVLDVHSQATAGLDGAIESAALDFIGGDVDLIHGLSREDVGTLGSIVENRVLVDLVANVVARMVNRVQLGHLAHVDAVDLDVLHVNDGDQLSGARNRGGTEDGIPTLELEVTKLNICGIKLHLEEGLSLRLVVQGCNVQEIDGCLVLERAHNLRVFHLNHGRLLRALPLRHQISLIGHEDLEGTVPVDRNNFELGATEAELVLLLLPKFVQFQDFRALIA